MEWLYVCLFSNGHIKVGRSTDPRSRVAAHAERVACMGVELLQQTAIACPSPAFVRETQLTAKCSEAASARFQNEWFAGLEFECVCSWASEIAGRDVEAAPPEMQALEEAMRLAGGAGALAARIGATASAPSMWRKRGSVPAEYCPAIERETGVRCERLRRSVDWDYLRMQAKSEPDERKAA